MKKNCFQLTYAQNLLFEKRDQDTLPLIDKDKSLTEEEKLEEKKTIEDANTLLKNFAEKGNKTIYKFTISDKKIRTERIFSEKEHGIQGIFTIIDRKTGDQETYKLTDKNEVQYYKSNLDRTQNFPFKFDYDLEIKKENKKVILGYECHKIIIVETCHHLENNVIEKNTIELYVTDEIDFPLHYLGFFSKPISELCALEMTYYRLNNLKLHHKLIATDIKWDMNPDYIKLPKKYIK